MTKQVAHIYTIESAMNDRTFRRGATADASDDGDDVDEATRRPTMPRGGHRHQHRTLAGAGGSGMATFPRKRREKDGTRRR